MTDKQALIDQYTGFYRKFGRFPKDAAEFAQYLGLENNEFLKSFNPLATLAAYIWEGYFDTARERSQADPAFENYSCREIYLSLLYNLVAVINEEADMNRSMFSFAAALPSAPKELKRLKTTAGDYLAEMIAAGQRSGEIADRTLVNSQYKRWTWWGMLFVIYFWKNDDSADGESTDVAIEKTAHLIFDILNPNAMDSTIQFFTFLFKEGMK